LFLDKVYVATGTPLSFKIHIHVAVESIYLYTEVSMVLQPIGDYFFNCHLSISTPKFTLCRYGRICIGIKSKMVHLCLHMIHCFWKNYLQKKVTSITGLWITVKRLHVLKI